jgi:hypothetical protein
MLVRPRDLADRLSQPQQVALLQGESDTGGNATTTQRTLPVR